MKLTARIPGKPTQTYVRELADLAAEKKLVSRRDALRIALHDAGHAVVNDPAKTGDAIACWTTEASGRSWRIVL